MQTRDILTDLTSTYISETTAGRLQIPTFEHFQKSIHLR